MAQKKSQSNDLNMFVCRVLPIFIIQRVQIYRYVIRHRQLCGSLQKILYNNERLNEDFMRTRTKHKHRFQTHDDVFKWRHFPFPRYWPFVGNSPVTGEFPTQRPVTRSFDAFFGLRLNKRLSEQSRSWWFETPTRPLWRHSNDVN